MEQLGWELSALQTLLFLIDLISDLQCPVDADVSLSLNCRCQPFNLTTLKF